MKINAHETLTLPTRDRSSHWQVSACTLAAVTGLGVAVLNGGELGCNCLAEL